MFTILKKMLLKRFKIRGKDKYKRLFRGFYQYQPHDT